MLVVWELWWLYGECWRLYSEWSGGSLAGLLVMKYEGSSLGLVALGSISIQLPTGWEGDRAMDSATVPVLAVFASSAMP